MSSDQTQREVRAGLTEEEMRARVIQLAFGGRPERFEAFCEAIREGLPADTAAVLRGSAVTGERWDDGAPFDADGPCTSDLDLTLVGGEVIGFYSPDASYADSYRSLHPREPGFTFPTWDPHLRLDYVFVPGASAARVKDCRVVDGDQGAARSSDHFPVVAELDVA